MNTVRPIRDENKLLEIQDELARADDPHGERMFLLFEVGIHTGLRISDLVRLRVENVSGECIRGVEKKTGKVTVIWLDSVLRVILRDRLNGKSPEALLFPSRDKRGNDTEHPITTRTAYNDMQIIARRFGLGDAIGCHTLRKTFGYWHYKRNHDLEILRQWFNHSSVQVTRRYIGIDEEEKRKSMQGHNPGGFQYQPRGSVRRGRPDTESAPLEITRQDRTKQGEIWGQRAVQQRERRKKK